MATDIRSRSAVAEAIVEAAQLLGGHIEYGVGDSIADAQKELRGALHTSEPHFFDGGALGVPNIADGLWEIARALHGVAEAIRGDARPVVRHVHERASKPEPEGDAGPQVTKVDKRRRAA